MADELEAGASAPQTPQAQAQSPAKPRDPSTIDDLFDAEGGELEADAEGAEGGDEVQAQADSGDAGGVDESQDAGLDGSAEDDGAGAQAPAQTQVQAPAKAQNDPIVTAVTQALAAQQQQFMPLIETLRQQNEMTSRRYEEAQNQMLALFQRAEAQKAAQALQASKPQPPDPSIATPADWSDFALKMSEWATKQQAAHINDQTSSVVRSFQEKLEKLEKHAAAMESERRREQTMSHVNSTLSRLKSTQGFEYLQNPAYESLFVDAWYAANAREPNGVADPMRVAANLRGLLNIRPIANQRDANKEIARNKRAVQNKRGTPRVLRGGPSNRVMSSKTPEQVAKEATALFRGASFDVDVA